MLLSMMRKHAKSWLIKFLIGIIAVVFIFYFGYSFTARQGLKVAYVNGELISGMEYQKTYRDLVESMRRQYKDVWDENLIKVFDLKNRALNNLITQKLISQEARRLGLEVTDSEIQKAIMDYPAFQVNGQFVMARYKSLLHHNRMKPEDFEKSMALELLDEKVKQLLFAFMEITDGELLDYYTYANEKIKISFVLFDPGSFKESVKLDKASMEKFFENNKQDYRIPEKIKVAYVEIDPKTFRDGVKIGDHEITGYYEYHMDAFAQPRQISARHILFKLARDASESEEKKVKKEAETVLEKARQGEDFASLAREYSQGPTKSKGGDLGYFSSGQMVKPFEDTAFKLRKGEISDLVRTRFGYHIIKVEDIKEERTKPIEEVRDQIVETLIKETSTELAHEKGLTLMDQMPYDVELASYAAEHGLEARNTGFFSQEDSIPDVGGSKTLRQSLFSLEENETSELMEVGGTFYLFQVTDRKASYLPEMNEIAEEVKEKFIDHLAAEEARSKAEGYLDVLQKGGLWEELAGEKDLEIEETDFFTRKDPVPKIGNNPGLHEVIFGLSEDKRYPDTIFENDKGAFVFRWEAKKDIDEEEFQEEKERYRYSLMQAKHSRAVENWVANLRKHAEIEIVSPVDSK